MGLSWMPLDIDDYRRDTAHLGAIEHGGYLMLIMHYWQHGSLPVDDRSLSRIACMTPAEWKRCRPTIAKFFSEQWKHKRVEFEIQKARSIMSKRSAAAKAMHSSRHANANANAYANAYANAELEMMQSGSKQDDTRVPHLTSSVAGATGGEPPSSYPIDPGERLWAEGMDLMLGMTVGEREARSAIGRWRKETKHDDARILGAIVRARELGSKDPIPLVTKILKPGNLNGNSADKSVHRAADRLVDRVQQFLDDAEPGEPMLAIGRQ